VPVLGPDHPVGPPGRVTLPSPDQLRATVVAWEGPGLMLVELSVVEQRYHAVMEVLSAGAPMVEVAERYGVSRKTVHTWIRRYRPERDGRAAHRPLGVPAPTGMIASSALLRERARRPTPEHPALPALEPP
jgi:hypothetical protein